MFAFHTRGEARRLAMLAGFSLSLLTMSLERDAILLALTGALLLGCLLSASSKSTSPDCWTIPASWTAALAVLTLIWLFWISTPASTAPGISLLSAWQVGLLPMGYLAGRMIFGFAGSHRFWLGAGAILIAEALYAGLRYLCGLDGRAMGTFLDPNAFGALMYCLLLPLMVLNADPRQSRRTQGIVLAGLIFGFFALFSTQSRGACGTLLLIAVLLIAGLRKSDIDLLKAAPRLGLIALLCYLAYQLTPSATHRTLYLSTDPSSQHRILMWRSAIAAWMDHPWIGTGIGTYRLQYFHYRLPDEISTTGDLAHNDYLEILMEGGPIGLLLLLAWLLTAVATAWRIYRIASSQNTVGESRLRAARGLSLALALLGLFVHANLNFIFYVSPLALLAGLFLAQVEHLALGGRLIQIHLPVRKWLAATIAALGIALAVGGLSLDWVASLVLSASMPKTRFSMVSKTPDARYEVAARFIRWRPDNLIVQQTLAFSATSGALLLRGKPEGQAWSQLAIIEGKRLLDICEGYSFAYQNLGRLIDAYPDLASQMAPLPGRPEDLFRLAIDRYPALPDNYRLLASELQQQGRNGEALEVLGSSLRWRSIPVGSRATAQAWAGLIKQGRELTRLEHTAGHSPSGTAVAREFSP